VRRSTTHARPARLPSQLLVTLRGNTYLHQHEHRVPIGASVSGAAHRCVSSLPGKVGGVAASEVHLVASDAVKADAHRRIDFQLEKLSKRIAQPFPQ